MYASMGGLFFQSACRVAVTCERGTEPAMCPRPRVSDTLLVLVFPLFFFLNQSSDISDTEGEAGGTRATEDTGLAPAARSILAHSWFRALHGGPGP